MEQEAREKEKRRQLNESTNNLLTGEPIPIEQSNYNVKSCSVVRLFTIEVTRTIRNPLSILNNPDYAIRLNIKISIKNLLIFEIKGGFFSDNGFATLDTTHALCLPLGASVSLLVMFFFFDSMQMLFAVCTASKFFPFVFHENHFINFVSYF